jgi:gliding motility-associated protein GldM
VLYQKTSDKYKPIDSLKAVIIPKKSNILAGENFEAEILLAAYDSKQSSEIVIGSKTFTADNGVYNYTIPTTAQGVFTLNGAIKVKEKDGLKEYPFTTSYNVFNGFSSVAADKLNVLFIGVDNPVTVSVPGYSTDKIRTTVSSGNITRIKDNKFNIIPTSPGKMNINVSAVDENGKTKNFGQFEYIAKKLPRSNAYIANIKAGPANKAILGTQKYLTSSAGPDFPMGNIPYRILNYECKILKGGYLLEYKVNNNSLTEEIKKAISGLKKGDIIFLTNIRVQNPSEIYTPDDSTYTIQ